VAIIKPTITIDGNFSDWIASERIDYGDLAGYSLYATAQNGFLYFDLNSLVAIGPNTTIWLNTDLNAATGFQIFGYAGGAEYNINIKADGTAALYTGADGQTLVLDNIPIAYSADHMSVELAIPLASIGNPANPIDVLYDVNNITFGPTSYSNQPYVAPNADVTRAPTHKVAIVYSDTTAKNYFRGLGDAVGAPSTTYSDLFMAAQNQARMAGVSYDVIDESQLTNVNNLIGYDALIFPAMANVNTAQLPAIMSALTSAVYDYHIGIITSGDFLTNDQTGAVLASPYAQMQTLLGLTRASGGNSGDVTVTAADVSNPIMAGYTAGEVIQHYSGVGYTGYTASGTTPYDVLVNQNVVGVGNVPGVVETTVGGTTNVHFATQALLGDNNLLSDAIHSVVLGIGAGVALNTSRMAGILAARMDMDQAQNPADVSPPVLDANGNPTGATGPGIYDKLIPILMQWKQQYDFTGSYYVDIGDNPNPTGQNVDPTTTNWLISLPYYQQIQALGGEIGSHSITHLINPPTKTFTAVGSASAGSTTITLDQVPAFYGITVGMWLSGSGIGTTTLASGAVVHTQVTAVSGNTITISYDPDGAGPGGNVGTTGTVSGTLTFSIPSENTNFLEPTTGTDKSSDGNPFTYQYEFGDSKTLLQQKLGTTIYGAAVPGAAETLTTSQNILAYYPSGSGYTGYVTGGWTGIESGYPSAFGYIDPTHQGSVYIAPNVTFDFTEIQYQGKTVAQAEADWAAQFSALTSHAAGTPILVWPIHDYGAADWNTTSNTPDDPLYTSQLYADFIAKAYGAGYEFVTLEDLASRIAAQEKASINYTTVGNTVTATVTPDPTAPDLGAMALDVVNNGTQVIQNVTGWYAYNAQELFLDRDGGTYTINLGTVQDDVTHIAALPMRGDLLSVAGDSLNLSFSMVGDGNVLVDLNGADTPVVTGATVVSQVGDQLTLGLTGLGQHNVSILVMARVMSVAFSADSGSSTADFITNVASQTISGTLSGPLGSGDVVKVSLDNGAHWLTATAAAGSTTFWLTTVLPAGGNTLIARVENAAAKFSTPFSHAYMLDQVAPAAPTAPDLIAASDLGVSSTDNITNKATPTFVGTAEAGSTVTLYDGAAAVGTGIVDTKGAWSITTTTALADGVQSITAKAADVAGNVSAASVALSVTIDTLAPAAPSAPNMTAASDTGDLDTDNITSITTPTFNGTAEVGSTVTLYDGATAVGSVVTPTTGKWTITSTILAAGAHSMSAKAADVAGNASAASTALAVTIETAIAAPPMPDLVDYSDSGVSSTDNITKVARPDIAGTAAVGSTVTVYDGATVIGTDLADATGSWIITAPALANGTHSITASAVGAAGSPSAASPALLVTIDTVVPGAPSVPDLTAASDTGASNTDNVTNVKAPTFTGTAEAGSTVSIFNGTTKVGTGVAGADQTWTVTTSAMADGVHVMTAKATDVAGNVSVASGSLSITIDATAPAAPTGLDLVTASDTGVSSTDNITKITTPTFTGLAAANSTVTLYDGATAVGNATASTTGTWSITTSTLANATHSITAKAADALGNVSAASSTLSVIIDTVANAPAFTGGSATTLSGTGEAGATVTILNGTTAAGTAIVGSGGNWSWGFVASSSVRSLTARQMDKAGNTSPSTSGSALIGTSGNNTLASTASNDILIGAGGTDTFSFATAFGKDIITDFAATGTAHDLIKFSGTGLNSGNVLAQTTQVGTGVVISDGSNTLTLNNVSKTSLTAADFSFA
jgi:serralysin